MFYYDHDDAKASCDKREKGNEKEKAFDLYVPLHCQRLRWVLGPDPHLTHVVHLPQQIKCGKPATTN